MFHEWPGWVTKQAANGERIRIPWHMWVRGNPEGTTLKDPRLERAKAFIAEYKNWLDIQSLTITADQAKTFFKALSNGRDDINGKTDRRSETAVNSGRRTA